MKKCSYIQEKKGVLIWRGGYCTNYRVYIGKFLAFFHRPVKSLIFKGHFDVTLYRIRNSPTFRVLFGTDLLGKVEKRREICWRFWTNFIHMAKQVIVRMSAPGVWDTLEEAAKGLGVSTATVSRRLREADPDLRYAPRVYAVRDKKTREWSVVVREGRGRKFVTAGQSLRKIQKSEIDGMKDITLAWYLRAGTLKDF